MERVKVSFKSKSVTLRFGNMTYGLFSLSLNSISRNPYGLEKTWLEQRKR